MSVPESGGVGATEWIDPQAVVAELRNIIHDLPSLGGVGLQAMLSGVCWCVVCGGGQGVGGAPGDVLGGVCWCVVGKEWNACARLGVLQGGLK